MDRTNIITLPNDSLRIRSARVGLITSDIKKLIEQMKEATLDWEQSRDHEVGVALAAVQVDKLYRVVVIRDDFDDKKNTNFQVFINPEIIKYEGDVVDDYEGCLSVKDIYGLVPRHTKIRVKALTEDGGEIRLRAEGFLARVFQHEIDHTIGKLFVDRIQDNPKAFHKLSSDGKIKPLTKEEREKAFSILW